MASPTKSAPNSPPVQDSPFYQYVNSLSPINPVKARPDGHSYANIDVPSPQLVFKTPNFSRQRYEHLSAVASENVLTGYTGNNTVSGNMNIHGPSCSMKECNNAEPSPDQPTISPSSCVAAYLANPMESDDNLSSSPEFCVKRGVKDTQGYKDIKDENKFKEISAEELSQPSILPVNGLVDYSGKSLIPNVGNNLLAQQDAGASHTGGVHQANNARRDASRIAVEQNKELLEKETITGVSLITPQQEENISRNILTYEDSNKITEVSTKEKLGLLPKAATVNSESCFLLASGAQHYNIVNQCDTDLSSLSISKVLDMDSYGIENISNSSQGVQDLNLSTTKAVQSTLDYIPQVQLDSSLKISENVRFVVSSAEAVSESTRKQTSNDQEDGAQYQRGKRKRLQFETVNNSRSNNPCSPILEYPSVESPITPSETESRNVPDAEPVTVSSQKVVIKSVPGNSLCRLSVDANCGGYQGRSSVNLPRHSGIGLHLNSVVSSGSTLCSKNMQMPIREAQKDECSVLHGDQTPQESKNCSAPISSQVPPSRMISSSEHSLSYSAAANFEDRYQGDQAILVPNPSINYRSPFSLIPHKMSLPSKFSNNNCITPCSMRGLSSEEVSRSGDSTQSSLKKKRKKAPEDGGPKHCNCKRTKCLKLYCDCFAAGSFCSEACACQGCSNKSEHEDTVLETRKQIESRNPLAFAPKVVARVVDPPKDSGESTLITPNSARHKRGCNCKKSMCLKRYCECYQAGVGCSFGCRCEGCKNKFGRRDELGEMSGMIVEHKRPNETSWERNLSGELESIEVKRELPNTTQSHSRLSPITPSIQMSIENHAPALQLPASYYPSPDSTSSFNPSHEAYRATVEGTSSLDPHGENLEYDIAGDANSFSPGWEGFPEMFSLSPLLKTPLASGSSSASKTGDHKVLLTKVFQGSGTGNLCVRSSPVTPLPRLGESKFVNEPDSDNGPHGVKENVVQEFPREDDPPVKTVKSSSPNQKRVFPPRHVTDDARTDPPSEPRSVRKFILQSVPSFPSLTPLSKNATGDDDA